MELPSDTDGYDEAVQQTGVVLVRGRQPFRVQELVVESVKAGHQVKALLSVLKFLCKVPL